jgi:hypothetical protein
VRDLRMKIAGLAVALGLGGFAGYAISSDNGPPAASGTLEGTKVVRRTVHAKRPKHKVGPAHARARSAHSLTSGPVSTGSSGSSSSSSSPVHTGSSGSGSSNNRRPVNTGSSGASGGGGPVSTGSSGGGGTTGGETEASGGGGGEVEGGD